MVDDFDRSELFDEDAERPRDRKIDDAKAVLLECFFSDDGTGVCYVVS